MSPIPDEHGQPEHIRAAIDPKSMRFTLDSMDIVDLISAELRKMLRSMAANQAASQGRSRVTDDDIRAVYGRATDELGRMVIDGR